ncbi:MAG: type II secretion system protein [Candidatus Paceibacterota bacterium]
MAKFFKKNKSNQGLTLIELLTVISIMAILSAIVFGNYRSGNDALSLDRASQKLAQDFRRVNEMSISGVGGGTYISYGIYFDTSLDTQYKIYGNVSAGSSNGYENGTDVVTEPVTLETGIKICSITNGTAVSTISVSFVPPMPVVYMDNSGSGNDISIVLAPTGESCVSPAKSKTVKINNVGRIDIVN